jgi:hypothetical protein
MKALAAVLCLALVACITADVPPSDAVRQLAPNGRLRAALPPDDPVSRDVARELARRLRVPLEATTFDAPFDVAFVGPEQARAAQLDSTTPYMILDGAPRVIALGRSKPEASEYLRTFVDELQAGGFVAAAIDRRGFKNRASAP